MEIIFIFSFFYLNLFGAIWILRDNQGKSTVSKALLASFFGPFYLPIYFNRFQFEWKRLAQRTSIEYRLFVQFLRFWGIWTIFWVILALIALFGTREVGFIILLPYLILIWFSPAPIYLLYAILTFLFGRIDPRLKRPSLINNQNLNANKLTIVIRVIGTFYGLVGISKVASSIYEAIINKFSYGMTYPLNIPQNSQMNNLFEHAHYIHKLQALENFVEGSVFCLIAYSLLRVKNWGRYLLIIYSGVTVIIIYVLKFHSEIIGDSRDLMDFITFFSTALTFRAGLAGMLIIFLFFPPVKHKFLRLDK